MRRPVVVVGVAALLSLVAGPAAAEPPLEVTDRVTDEVAALGPGAEAARTAVADLAAEADLGVHAVFVSSFDSADPGTWAEDTAQLSGLGESDLLLAVAVGQETYEYGWWVDDDFALSQVDVEAVVADEVQPRLDTRDWSGAVVALSDGLGSLADPAEEEEAAGPQWSATRTLAVVGGVAVVLLAAHLLSRRRSSTGPSR